MSEPQPAGPDLHAIFDLDAPASAAEDPVVSVEPEAGPELADVTLEALELDGADAEAAEAAGNDDAGAEVPWAGITRPSRRGSTPRFLTDVIVDMGLASREQVEEAIEASRTAGTTP